MTINVKISLCKITRASKLFQRNYYLPLLKPLSPKDALRRKIITGQNVLGNRIEHYIPTWETYEERMIRRKKRVKGKPVIKKRVRMSSRFRYVTPFFDEGMEGHERLRSLINRKPKGKGQHYVYEVPDKGCALVLPFQFEKAIRDKEVVDVVMAQRSEKVVLKLSNGVRITMPVASYDGRAPLYRGSGWTREAIEEEHHHGKETFSLARLFEAKEQGVEEWELEMMRMANKRKKKVKGEDAPDWKDMMSGCLENMDWNKFEEDTKQIVDEKDEIVEEEDIPMAVDSMEKTKNVNDKLRTGGADVLAQLPIMKEVPEVIKMMDAGSGEMCEMQEVSGMKVQLQSGLRFVAGQMVKDDDEKETFVPGQTITNDAGNSEYTPGITINLDGEIEMIPGLVFGEDNSGAMFLPGESTITEDGQLQFEATEDDLPPKPYSPTPTPSPSSESSRSPSPEPKPKPKDEPIVIKLRDFNEEPIVKEKKKKKKAQVTLEKKPEVRVRKRHGLSPLEDPMKLILERMRKEEEDEKKRMKAHAEERMLKEERKVDLLRLEVRKKTRNLKFEKPAPYQPIEPVKKSARLTELEESIKNGNFFEDEQAMKILENVRQSTRLFRYKDILKNCIGCGFAKYSSIGYHSCYLDVSRSFRIPLFNRSAEAPARQ